MDLSLAFKKHYVAIVGGSISGAEAANLLAQKGFIVVVFEMNVLPYGKIEDGLPKWHINLRNRQMKEINDRLTHPNILYVPKTKIGVDVDFSSLKKDWGFSAVILANGSWNDRVLPIPLIEKFRDKELIYQNSFINWFNHKHEQNYSGKNYFINGNVVVIGGGLASLDVMKIVMMELVKKQLYLKKGIYIDIITLEKRGIFETLNAFNTSLEELDVRKAKLVYRRTAKEMPLKTSKDKSLESVKTAQRISQKLLLKYEQKYLFEFIPSSIPTSFIEENGKLKKVVFQKIVNSEVDPYLIERDSFELPVDILVSSIGSVSEQIKGVVYENSFLKMHENSNYRVWGHDNVFAIGNAVTGRGNIQDSKKHGKQMTELIVDNYLRDDEIENWLIKQNDGIRFRINHQIDGIFNEITKSEIPSNIILKEIVKKVDSIQKKIGYTNYKKWIISNTPVRIEDVIKNKTNCKCI